VSRCDEAISTSEADQAFARLSSFDHLMLAVSGGPDSLALLHLVAEWQTRVGTGAPQVIVATVDHGLRDESAREAEIVAQMSAALGLPQATLRWEGAKPARGIPNAARGARYALLQSHARALAPEARVAVVTAHHQDDQAETFFMRLARGGGVEALAAMADDRPLSAGSPPVRLVRPLLAFSKSRLIASLALRGVTWLDDPTNANAKFERTRVRTALLASGLDSAALAATARRMREAGEGLGYAATHLKDTMALSLNNGIYASFDRQVFDAGPAILRQMVLAELIGFYGGSTPNPEVSEIESLVARMSGQSEIKATLGGAVVSAGPRTIRIWREYGRLTVPDLVLTTGEPHAWDDRFWVSFEGASGEAVTVRPLGPAGYETIAQSLPEKLRPPAAAAYALPAFWADATLLAVPPLLLQTEDMRSFGGLELVCQQISVT
jgi:tRNA(Ile)-lysidine synthase